MELGGFAKNESEIDGNFKAYNYCLAENYINAIYENKMTCFAKIYLSKKIYSPKLILTILLSDDEYS